MVASAEILAHVFFHTNRPIRAPSHADIKSHTGWWASNHDMRQYEVRTSKLFKREEFPYHAKFAGLQGFKYQWLAAETGSGGGAGIAGSSSSGAGGAGGGLLGNGLPTHAAGKFAEERLTEPWLLLDTDTVVQCSGAELRERFGRFRAPLVIGAEFQWWPKRDKLALARGLDPWPPQPSPFLRYPNSGLIAGTRHGFRQLEAAFRESSPRYPCCPKLHNGTRSKKCHIDDQHCLQV